MHYRTILDALRAGFAWFVLLCACTLSLFGATSAAGQTRMYRMKISPEEYQRLPVGAEYEVNGELLAKGKPGEGNRLVSHKPGCRILPNRKPGEQYAPAQSPDCREEVPEPKLPSWAAPIPYPAAVPQTHGLDLARHDEATAAAYFKWLCEHDAGEWVYRRVDNVDGVFEMRDRPYHSGGLWEQFNRYYLEDPWGQVSDRNLGPETLSLHRLSGDRSYVLLDGRGFLGPVGFNQYSLKETYNYYERPVTQEEYLNALRYPHAYGHLNGPSYLRFMRPWPEEPYFTSDKKELRRYSEVLAPGLEAARPFQQRKPGEVMLWARNREHARLIKLAPEPTNEIRSRYGFTWRGITRSENDRALGIAGTEELVVDLQTGELLFLRRVFIKGPSVGAKNMIAWRERQQCPMAKEVLVDILRPALPTQLRGLDLAKLPAPDEANPKP
ncbi:hypothetical protein [Viridibacterium curvum]|uniref:Uncharacterized protein n=1 Tax=Viridibacterium curvum TaxID=1101404 RepID=A0ABP9QHH6_9RHOO